MAYSSQWDLRWDFQAQIPASRGIASIECVLKFLLESLARKVFIATLRLSVGQHSPKAGFNVDVLIESTKHFEQDLGRLNQDKKNVVIQKINDFVSLFPEHKSEGYRKLRRINYPSGLNGYDSSLYTLKISHQIRVILSVDEDPIFDQMIFTLFRVVTYDELNKAYQSIAESLYQDILHHDIEIAQVV